MLTTLQYLLRYNYFSRQNNLTGGMAMKKLLVLALLLAVATTMVFAAAAEQGTDEGAVPARTLDYIHLGNQAIRQEFVWDDAAGVFKTVNIYTTGEAGNNVANMEQIMQGGAAGDGDLVGTAAAYTYWNGTQWVTLDNVTRYEGQDDRAEAVVSRYDLTFYTQSTSYWYAVTGYQTLYSTSYQTRVYQKDIGGKEVLVTEHIPHVKVAGSVAKTGTFSHVTNVAAAFDPIVEIELANGWSIKITSHYDTWGNMVSMTSPSGQTSIVYGDPHLLQAGGTQQQELAAIGNYVFDLGEYTLDLGCMASQGGFSLVTDLKLTGPNGYELTYGRNNEVKVSGGTN